MKVWHPDDDREPRLGMQISVDGRAMPIPLGAVIYVDLVPGDATQMIPMVLTRITKNNLEFRHHCGKPTCNLTFNYHRKITGFHPTTPEEEQVLQDLKKHGARKLKRLKR